MKKLNAFFSKLGKVLKALWLLFPSLIFLIIVWQCFWVLTQGKDIMIASLERYAVGGIFLVALVFYVFITWYTGRILLYRKKEFSEILYQHYKSQENKPESQQQDLEGYLQVIFNLPRLLGFLIFSIIWIGFLRLVPLPELGFMFRISLVASYVLLGLTIVVYFLLYKIASIIRHNRFEQKHGKPIPPVEQTKKKNKLFVGYLLLLLAAVIANFIWHSPWLLLFSVFVLQFVFPFIVVIRRTRSDLATLPLMNSGSFEDWLRQEKASPGPLKKMMYYANIPLSERKFFLWFNIISGIGIVIYLLTIFDFSFSTWIGSFSFVLLAFGVLVGFLAMISLFSVVKGINFHFIVFVLMIIIGQIPGLEPHHVNLIPYSEASAKPFDARPNLHTYFSKWIANRKIDLESASSYPVYFVLSDGGASRSGYWTASALGNLEDSSRGKFSRHLFCLSGASGGSVGNGTFFALLHQARSGVPINSYSEEARKFLRQDFLTYTLGRMLGPDFVRFLLPLPFVDDRAEALEHAIEEGGDKTGTMFRKMAQPLSAMIPYQSANNDLPILCINVTRMQDGRPGVVCNMRLGEKIFGKRLDVLDTLNAGKDMKLSTGVVLGARFPYVSPAGRINNDYYVDGGYFDNSGAGVVHEMIIELQRMIHDSLGVNKAPYLTKLKFYVLHVMNSPEGDPPAEKVHPLKNDLLAPILTLVGSYSTQTTVNNLRLVKYLEDLNKGVDTYIKIGLYQDGNHEDFPMNWTISNHYRALMNQRLKNNRTLKRMMGEISNLPQ